MEKLTIFTEIEVPVNCSGRGEFVRWMDDTTQTADIHGLEMSYVKQNG